LKKNILMFLSALFLSAVSFSQVLNIIPNQTFGAEERAIISNGAEKSMGFWVLPYSGATSPATRIPGNTWRYQRTQYLITKSEIAASGFPSGYIIDEIGYYISQLGVGTQTGNLKIYMKNTTDVTYTLGSTWTTTDFTLVCDIASWTVPIEVGLYTIPFSGGSLFTYTGEGVYVAFEFSNPSGSLGTDAISARCNDLLSSGLRGDRSNSSMPTMLAASAWRPATQFINNSLVDIAEITNIYTLEKVAVGYENTPIGVRVVNVSSAATTFDVTVTVKDIENTITYFTSTQTVSNLAAGASTMVNFTGWNPTIPGDVYVFAETSDIPDETWTTNNSLSIMASVNTSILSYSFNNDNPSNFGYLHPNTGLFLSKYTMNGIGNVIGANLVISNSATAPGNTIYAVVLSGSGTILSQSANYIIQASDLGTTKSFTFPSPPEFGNEDFYVGLAQTAGSQTYYPLGRFTENPQRPNTFYAATLTGGALTEIENTFKLKFGIEAIVELSALCLQPVELDAKDITQTSANLTWTPDGSATAWEYVYGVAPLSTPTGSGIATASTTTNPISELEHNTTYQFYVRSDCGEDSFSEWAGPHTFATCTDVIAGEDSEICGNSTTLNGNEPEPGNTGNWTIISGSATIVNPALYNTAVTDATYGEVTFRWTIDNGGSQCYDDVTTTFIENPTADFNFEVNGLEVTFANSSENATSYFWDFDDGNNSTDENPIHTYASAGNYTVVLTAFNAICEDEFSEEISITVGIFDISNGRIKIYPNPTSGVINLSDENLIIQNIEITDIAGKTIFDSKDLIRGSNFEIDLRSQPSGIYTLKIQTGNGVFTEKIMKK